MPPVARSSTCWCQCGLCDTPLPAVAGFVPPTLAPGSRGRRHSASTGQWWANRIDKKLRSERGRERQGEPSGIPWARPAPGTARPPDSARQPPTDQEVRHPTRECQTDNLSRSGFRGNLVLVDTPGARPILGRPGAAKYSLDPTGRTGALIQVWGDFPRSRPSLDEEWTRHPILSRALKVEAFHGQVLARTRPRFLDTRRSGLAFTGRLVRRI